MLIPDVGEVVNTVNVAPCPGLGEFISSEKK
jgi:hypothetical protein